MGILEWAMNNLQTVFGADNAVDLIDNMSTLLIIFGIFNAVSSWASTSLALYSSEFAHINSRAAEPYMVNPSIAWIIQESPAFLVPAIMLIFTSYSIGGTNQVLIFIFMLHYFHRAFIFPIFLRNGRRSFVIVAFSAALFSAYDGFLISYNLLYQAKYQNDYLLGTTAFLGIYIFVSGMFINVHSDYILVNLRSSVAPGLKFPKGGMFEYVSSANYFGEILEWWGFFIATWTYPAFAFAIFTTANLTPRAIYNHRIYLKNVKDYPENRKALIPFIL